MDDVLQTLASLNQAWRQRRFDDLPQYFDENVVMKGPDLKEMVRGRDKLVQSYIDFMTRSEVTECAESNHFADEWETTAVAGYDWTMTWLSGGKTSRESGHDLFQFQRRGSAWVAVMRVMLF